MFPEGIWKFFVRSGFAEAKGDATTIDAVTIPRTKRIRVERVSDVLVMGSS
jgi:hypothetical protein